MEVYRSLAAILTATAASAADPIDLIASQLLTAPPAQKSELARILAELLRAQSAPAPAAQAALHTHVRTLITTASLDDVAAPFKQAVELADPALLRALLRETTATLDALLTRARTAHVSSDDAFAVDASAFLARHAPGAETAADRPGLRDAAVRLLRFWHFLLMGDGAGAVEAELMASFGAALPARLVGAMALRDVGVAKAASGVLCCFVGDFDSALPAGASQVLLPLEINSFSRLMLCVFVCVKDAVGWYRQPGDGGRERRSCARPVAALDRRRRGRGEADSGDPGARWILGLDQAVSCHRLLGEKKIQSSSAQHVDLARANANFYQVTPVLFFANHSLSQFSQNIFVRSQETHADCGGMDEIHDAD